MAQGALERFNRITGRAAQTISNLFLILILVGVFTEVVSRYIFQQSHGFMEELCKWSQIWIAYLMMGLVEMSRSHIKVDILFQALSDKARKRLTLVFDLVGLAFAATLFFSALASIRNLYMLGSKSTSGIPVPLWVPATAALAGAVLLASFCLGHLLAELRPGKGSSEPGSTEGRRG